MTDKRGQSSEHVMSDAGQFAPERGSGLAFIEHLEWAAKTGLRPWYAARNIRSAVSQILKSDQDWSNMDVRHLDVDALIARFRDRSHHLKPASLGQYESRFRSALASYLAYLDNPSADQPKARRLSRTLDYQSNRNVPELLAYPFPLRPGVLAELKLPPDLTIEEATRLSALVKMVSLPDQSEAK